MLDCREPPKPPGPLSTGIRPAGGHSPHGKAQGLTRNAAKVRLALDNQSMERQAHRSSLRGCPHRGQRSCDRAGGPRSYNRNRDPAGRAPRAPSCHQDHRAGSTSKTAPGCSSGTGNLPGRRLSAIHSRALLQEMRMAVHRITEPARLPGPGCMRQKTGPAYEPARPRMLPQQPRPPRMATIRRQPGAASVTQDRPAEAQAPPLGAAALWSPVSRRKI